MCQRQPAGTQWAAAEGARAADQECQQPAASVHRREPRVGHRHAQRAAAARVGASRRAGVHHQPCAEPPPPSSLPSIPCGSP